MRSCYKWAGIVLAGLLYISSPATVSAEVYFQWIYDDSTVNLMRAGEVVNYTRLNSATSRTFLQTNGNVTVVPTTNGGTPIYQLTCLTGLCWVGVFHYIANPDPMPEILEQGDTLYRGTGVVVAEYDGLQMLAFGHNPNAFISALSGFISTPPISNILTGGIAIWICVRLARVLLSFLSDLNAGTDYRLEGENSITMTESALKRKYATNAGIDPDSPSVSISSGSGTRSYPNPYYHNDDNENGSSEGSYDGDE